MEFNGTIVITDPCYIIKAKHHGTIPNTNDDWNACNYGKNLDKLGITHYLSESTQFGDWTCDVITTKDKTIIGEFCADSGMVAVMLLDEILAYNPEFDYHIKAPWSTTVIKDFKGHVFIEPQENSGVTVVGRGNLDFESIITGL